MKKDIRIQRLDSLTEQVHEDHRQLLVGLATERDTTRRAFEELARRVDESQTRQYDLMATHATRVEARFAEMAQLLKDDPPEAIWREELDAIKVRLDRLENPPAA